MTLEEQQAQLAILLGIAPEGMDGKLGINQAPGIPIRTGEFGPSGPQNIVNHHTAGNTLEGALNSRHPLTGNAVGYNYYVGPDARVTERVPPTHYAPHMSGSDRMPGSGVNSRNSLSVSAVAPSDAGITDDQRWVQGRLNRQLGQAFNISPGRHFGHGELQGDRTTDEGAAVSQAFRGQDVDPALFANMGGQPRMGLGRSPAPGEPPPASPPGTPLARTPEQGAPVREGLPSGGAWSTFASQPGNRAFLINMGLSMMTGGWGGSMDTMARAIAAGYQAKQATEEGGDRREREQAEETRRQGRFESQTQLDSARAGYYQGGGARRPGATAPSPQNRSMQRFLEVYGQGPIDPQQWEQDNMPGGVIHAAFGGPVPLERANDYIQQAQYGATRRADQEISMEELIGMGQSRDPGERNRFQVESRRRFGSRAGHEYQVSPEGDIRPVPIPRAAGGRGGSQDRFAAAQQGGIDHARLSIGNVRDWVTSQTAPGPLAMGNRALQQQTGVGTYPQVLNSLKDGVMSYVHARSGAQVAVREFEHYLSTRMPERGDSQRRIEYKMADLELALMLIGRRRGDANITTEELYNKFNDTRRLSDLPIVSSQEFERLLPSIESQAGIGAVGANRRLTPPPGTDVAPPAGAPRQQQRPPTLGGEDRREEYRNRYGLE